MNKMLTTESISMIMASARDSVGKSQKHMAKAMSKSVGTVQNWEYGYSMPNIIEFLEWFEVLGINPLRHILQFLHPEEFKPGVEVPTDDLRAAVIKWFSDVATDAGIRKTAFCIFGNTGSSYYGQIDMLCALNHLPIMDRINIAENIYNLYMLREARDELRGLEHISPDIVNLKECIDQCKAAVFSGKLDYSN